MNFPGQKICFRSFFGLIILIKILCLSPKCKVIFPAYSDAKIYKEKNEIVNSA